MRNTQHGKAVLDLGSAATEDEGGLVAQAELGLHRLEMPQVQRNVLCLDRGPERVDHVEGLREPNEIAEIAECPRAPSSQAVGDVRRTGNGHHREAPPADRDDAIRTATDKLYRARRSGECLFDETAIEADHFRSFVHEGAGAGEPTARAGVEHTDAEVLQDREGGQMQHLDVVIGEHAQGVERVLEPAVARGAGQVRCGLRQVAAAPATAAH
jgi:hypothetical protein